MIETEDRAMARSAPTHADLERAIESVPGVVEARVSRVEETGKSRLRIRLANDEDAESVSWSIAATLRERFGISLDPDQIRPRAVPAAVTADSAAEADEGTSDAAELLGAGAAADGTDATEAAAAEEDGVVVSGDRVLLSEAARALLEDAVAQAREAELADDAATTDDAPAANAPDDVTPDAPDDVTPDVPDDVTPDVPDDVTPAIVATGTADDTAGTAAARSEPCADVSALADTHRGRDDGTRARIRHLDTRVDISDVEVTATLGFGDREVTGSARAVATEQGILRAVAEATLLALSDLTGERLVAGVDSVAASVTGEPPIATVIVSLVTDRGDEALLGSSLVRKDPQRAVMRATLDALNRRVEPWLEVEIAG